MEWEKIFADDTTDKGLIPTIYKELLKLNTQETNNPVKKMGIRHEQTLSREDIRMVNRHMKKCSTSFGVREIKTTMRYHLIPVRMAKINKTGNKFW